MDADRVRALLLAGAVGQQGGDLLTPVATEASPRQITRRV